MLDSPTPAATPRYRLESRGLLDCPIVGVAGDGALQLRVDNWRWSGVPFFIRTGKNLPVTVTELRLLFKHPPLLDAPPEVQPYDDGSPPIADYAFLSDCHTSALVARDDSIDWLCVPRFDSPSVFGSLLDRQAGSFRLGPFGINVPTARFYEPGTDVLATTWKTPTGWVLVRDALRIGPQHGEDLITPHTRPPVDDDADHMLVRTVLCLDGNLELELVCEPDFDYGRAPAQWSLLGDDRHSADARAGDLTVRLRTDLALGIEGDRVRARHVLEQGDQAYCALSWAEATSCRRTSTRRTPGSPRRCGSGAAGWAARGCPTTAGATRSSARR